MMSPRRGRTPPGPDKISWDGLVIAVQPRIRLTRSFDQRSHTYQGFLLLVNGAIGGEHREFTVGIGEGAQTKHQFQAGIWVEGQAVRVANPLLEVCELYRASKLKAGRPPSEPPPEPPPWHGIPPDLPTYRQRGRRRLSARTFDTRCRTCIWGCRMAVEMIIDHWNPHQRDHRQETFCYGPLSCPLHRPGPVRRVPGRNGMAWVEEDWVDEDATAHRDPDE